MTDGAIQVPAMYPYCKRCDNMVEMVAIRWARQDWHGGVAEAKGFDTKGHFVKWERTLAMNVHESRN
jgi:hypothetical protein